MKHYYGDKMKEDEMDWACNTHGRDEKFVRDFKWITWKKDTRWRPSEGGRMILKRILNMI
jgi:hypothetical protein